MMTLNHGENMNNLSPMTPITPIPIDRCEVIPVLHSLNIGEENNDYNHNNDDHGEPVLKSLSNEDDDIKYRKQQQQHEQEEYGEQQQLIFDNIMLSVIGNKDCHEGPNRITNESQNNQSNNNENINNNDNNNNKSKSKSVSKSSTSSKSSSSSIATTTTTNTNNNVNNTKTGISRRSASTLSEEPEYFDGEIFREKYVIGGKINEGGFGSVWKIRDNQLYSKCVKIMDLGKDHQSQTRRRKACIREFNMTKKAFSDEIVEVELYIDNQQIMQCPKAYLIMPYFEGKDLFEFIDDDDYFKKVSTQTMLHIFYKIAEKLYELHYFKRIVHGDLKPENVMILQNHKSDEIEVEIIDYGIAKSIRNLSSDAKFLKSKGHFGTKGYVAPELMTHYKYNRKIDVFSAGVVLYNMVTECCLFPKGHKYYRLSQEEYYKYLKKKFKCIKKKRTIIDLLYACLAFDPDERLDVKQLIERYFHSRR